MISSGLGIVDLPSEFLYKSFLETKEKDIPPLVQTCRLFHSIIQGQAQNIQLKIKIVVDHLISHLQPKDAIVVPVEDDDYLMKKLQALKDTIASDKTMRFHEIRKAVLSRIDLLSELFGWDISTSNSLKEYVIQYGDPFVLSKLKEFSAPPEVIKICRNIDKITAEPSDKEFKERISENIEQLLQKGLLTVAYGTFKNTGMSFKSNDRMLRNMQNLAEEQGQEDIEEALRTQGRLQGRLKAGKLLLISFIPITVALVVVPIICSNDKMSIGMKVGSSLGFLAVCTLFGAFPPILVYFDKGREYVSWQSIAAATSNIAQTMYKCCCK